MESREFFKDKEMSENNKEGVKQQKKWGGGQIFLKKHKNPVCPII